MPDPGTRPARTMRFDGASVFVTGGWDDFLNTKAKQDSLFVGAGVRWGDDDIKYIAGAASAAR